MTKRGLVTCLTEIILETNRPSLNSQTATHILAQLQRSVQNELELIQKFVLVLQSEAQILAIPNDSAALNASTAIKNQLIEQLTHAVQTRANWLKQLGYGADQSALAAAAADDPALQALCDDLISATRQANDLNMSNGIIIDTYIEHNQQAINTLRHLISSDSLYDASGRTKTLPANNKRNVKIA